MACGRKHVHTAPLPRHVVTTHCYVRGNRRSTRFACRLDVQLMRNTSVISHAWLISGRSQLSRRQHRSADSPTHRCCRCPTCHSNGVLAHVHDHATQLLYMCRQDDINVPDVIEQLRNFLKGSVPSMCHEVIRNFIYGLYRMFDN